MRHRLRFSAMIIVECRPDASEGEQRSVIIEREPHHVLFLRLRVRLRRVLGEAVGRDQAAVLSTEPRPPLDEVYLMFVTGYPSANGGGGMPHRIMVGSRPSSGVAHHRSRLIWKHARHRREVADIAIDDAEQSSYGSLVGRDRIEIAQELFLHGSAHSS